MKNLFLALFTVLLTSAFAQPPISADSVYWSSKYCDTAETAEDALTSTKARVNTMVLDNIVSSGGSCDLKALDVGELIIEFGRYGGDSSLVTKSFTVSSTVKSMSWIVDGNIEVLMGEVSRMPD